MAIVEYLKVRPSSPFQVALVACCLLQFFSSVMFLVSPPFSSTHFFFFSISSCLLLLVCGEMCTGGLSIYASSCLPNRFPRPGATVEITAEKQEMQLEPSGNDFDWVEKETVFKKRKEVLIGWRERQEPTDRVDLLTTNVAATFASNMRTPQCFMHTFSLAGDWTRRELQTPAIQYVHRVGPALNGSLLSLPHNPTCQKRNWWTWMI